MPVEQVNQAVLVARDEQSHGNSPSAKDHSPRESGAIGKRSEGPAKLRFIQVEAIERPFDAHEEQVQLRVLMLVGMQDVPAMREEEVRDQGDQTFAVGRVEQQNRALIHVNELLDSRLHNSAYITRRGVRFEIKDVSLQTAAMM